MINMIAILTNGKKFGTIVLMTRQREINIGIKLLKFEILQISNMQLILRISLSIKLKMINKKDKKLNYFMPNQS